MDEVQLKTKNNKGFTREQLENFDKNELVDKILQLEAHNFNLRNILSKHLSPDAKGGNERKNRKFDFSKFNSRKVLLRIMYFGWDYHGLVVQEDSNQTIEHHLFHALKKTCLIENRETSNYHRCGRTDKGVSSFGQVISISLRSKFYPEHQNEPFAIGTEIPYCKILNRILPKDIRVLAWMPVPTDLPEYSARFDCNSRKYKYFFPRASLDVSAMRAACAHLVGSHDFRHLCKMDVGNGVTQFQRNVFAADIVPVEDKEDGEGKPTDMFAFVIESKAFVWHQIRCIMGVLLLVGQGKESPDVVKDLMDVETNPRKPQYNMALDLPLNLFRCSYEWEKSQKWIYDPESLKCILGHLQHEWTIQNIKSTMIKDSIEQLEGEYSKLCPNETEEGKRDRDLSYAIRLAQGVRSKTYVPLMKRQTCSSLEERVEHFKKRRKIGDKLGA